MAKIIRKAPAKSGSHSAQRAGKPDVQSGLKLRHATSAKKGLVKKGLVKKAEAKSPPRGTKTSPRARSKSVSKSATKPWTSAEVYEAFSRFRKANPEPKGELEHLNPYTLLVAVVLSAQATDAGVNKATRALFAVADTPQKMIAIGEDRLRDYIKTIGLYRTKAKNVIALSKKLIDDFGSEVPRTRAEIESLPGAGRKTANVVLNMAFGERTMAVDTHVFRVANRTGLAPGKTPLEVELGLERVIPPEFMLHAHHWLILHGRYTCLARGPRCEVCLINDLCRWPEKTI
jgi:endonuclease-3